MTKASKRLAVGMAITLALAGLGAFAYYETRSAERDRHAILAGVQDIQRMLQQHRVMANELFFSVEGQHRPGEPKPKNEEGHQALLRASERLAHLDEFAMVDVRLELVGDVAVVRCRVQGHATISSEAVPESAEMRFERTGRGWHVTSLVFVERR